MSNLCPAADLINEAEEAAKRCFGLTNPRIAALHGGRVNESFLVDCTEGRFVLQKLNDIYQAPEALGRNWHSVQEALSHRAESWPAKPVPEIFPDLSGCYTACSPDDCGHWRLTSFIDGLPAPKTPAGALQAARLTGALHRLLNSPAPIDLLPPQEGEFTNRRLSSPEDFEVLEVQYRRHPNLDSLKPLISEGADAALQLPFFPGFLNAFNLQDVVIHGDPKADNFIFSHSGQAVALVDWDNICYGHVLVDVAEMLRSWGAEMDGAPTVLLENIGAVMEGYAETGLMLSPQEITLLPSVFRAVTVTLARRYLTDALAEVFFKLDSDHYSSLYEQNRSRAEMMINLAEILLKNEMIIIEIINEAYRQGLSRRIESIQDIRIV